PAPPDPSPPSLPDALPISLTVPTLTKQPIVDQLHVRTPGTGVNGLVHRRQRPRDRRRRPPSPALSGGRSGLGHSAIGLGHSAIVRWPRTAMNARGGRMPEHRAASVKV